MSAQLRLTLDDYYAERLDRARGAATRTAYALSLIQNALRGNAVAFDLAQGDSVTLTGTPWPVAPGTVYKVTAVAPEQDGNMTFTLEPEAYRD